MSEGKIIPNISTRKYIRWIPDQDEPSEPTSTLVLTTAERYYVDVRLFKPDTLDAPTDEPLPLTRLQWAFAGTRTPTTSHLDPVTGEMIDHCAWNHFIDSNTDKDASEIVDEGDLYDQPDGIHCLERGTMINPATGVMTAYDEMWADEPVERTGDDSDRKAVVLSCNTRSKRETGIIVRVGQWCQGLLKVTATTPGEPFSSITVERWKWSKESPGSGWRLVAKIGERSMPCSLTFDPDKLPEGGLDHDRLRWSTIENFSW